MSGALLERGTQPGWGGAQTSFEFAPRAPQRGTSGLLRADAGTAADSLGAVLTLDALVAGTWHALQRGQQVACPACDGEMTPILTGAAEASEGWCGDCGCALL